MSKQLQQAPTKRPQLKLSLRPPIPGQLDLLMTEPLLKGNKPTPLSHSFVPHLCLPGWICLEGFHGDWGVSVAGDHETRSGGALCSSSRVTRDCIAMYMRDPEFRTTAPLIIAFVI